MSTELNTQNLETLRAHWPAGQPLWMVNLLRFRDKAQYTQGTEPKGSTGREAYFHGYVAGFAQVVAALGIEHVQPVWAGVVHGLAAGPSGEVWHASAIVEYPDFATFERITQSDAYTRLALPYRRAALEDWRLIATTKLELP